MLAEHNNRNKLEPPKQTSFEGSGLFCHSKHKVNSRKSYRKKTKLDAESNGIMAIIMVQSVTQNRKKK